MSNQNSSNWNSPDYFKLFDDLGSWNTGPVNENNIANGNNYNFGSFDFYGNSLANGIGSNNNGTIASTTPASSLSISGSHSTVNQTFQYQYQYDYGNEPQHNTSNRNFDSGSNFMLLMEDFSAYFYNYNGSVGTGIGTTSTTFNNYNNNNTGFDLQYNCSLINSTCNDTLGKHLLLFLPTL